MYIILYYIINYIYINMNIDIMNKKKGCKKGNIRVFYSNRN